MNMIIVLYWRTSKDKTFKFIKRKSEIDITL